MNQSSHLPLKLNMSGVIPPIFASSLIMFPATILDLVPATCAETARWLQAVAQALAPGEPLTWCCTRALIIGFAFFYTALVFNSQETADNLQEVGRADPGHPPGQGHGEYIDGVLTRLTGCRRAVPGGGVPAARDHAHWAGNVPFYFGGTSLLIVVVVVMDFTAQVQAHLMSHQYESLMKKANLKGGPRAAARLRTRQSCGAR